MASPLGDPLGAEHHDFVNQCDERFRYYREKRMFVLEQTLEFWDLYLSQRREFRQKGEEWRANMALPDAFASVEAKIANLASIMLSSDPVVQAEAVHEGWLDEARSIERLIDYTYRKNQFTKFLIKMLRARAVTGTSFYKLTWTERVHTVTLSRDANAIAAYSDKVNYIKESDPLMQSMIPDWITDTDAFEKWRKLYNLSDKSKGLKLGPPPADGPQRFVLYRGPLFSLLPISSVYIDPHTDEMSRQNFVVHRTVKPLSWVEKNKDKFDQKALAYAMDGWDGQVEEQEEVALAQKMGLAADASAASDPYYDKAVEFREVWQPGGEIPYALIMNNRAVVNKNPLELPFIHGECAVGASRTVVVPGQFYGISDLAPARDIFWEKRKLRNLRLDAVTFTVLPAFSRLKEVGIPDNLMATLRPGALIPLSRPDAISPLIKHALPPEAYKEPEGLDAEISDSMGVYASTKGAPAAIGRVTGTEFQGRENRAQIRLKLDSMFLEEELYPTNRQQLGLYAQMGSDPLILKVGGAPDPFIRLDRATLLEAMEQQWRFRGPNKAVNKDMQVQQLTMWMKTFGADLQPQERRFAARLILDVLDIRGADKLISDSGTANLSIQTGAAQQAGNTAQGAANKANEEAQVNVPASVPGDVASAIEKGGM